MKNLMLTYSDHPTVNIGDYIQSLAAKQFFSTDEIVTFNRDELANYSGVKAKLVMNGWFTYKPENFPPSKNIIPLFVSFHLNKTAQKSILECQHNIKYFKKYEPIGCRDYGTAEALNDRGISSYFSSCLTTTLSKKYLAKNHDREIVYIVDPLSYMPNGKSVKEVVITIFQYVANIRGVNNIIKKYKKENKFNIGFNKVGIGRVLLATKSYLLLKQVVDDGLLEAAVFITQFNANSEYPSEESRFVRAEELLDKYSNARLVITSRIHCALPCLSLDTPVVFLNNVKDEEKSSCRLNGILDFFHVINFKSGKVLDKNFKKINSNSAIKNSDDFLLFKDDLIRKVSAFFKADININ